MQPAARGVPAVSLGVPHGPLGLYWGVPSLTQPRWVGGAPGAPPYPWWGAIPVPSDAPSCPVPRRCLRGSPGSDFASMAASSFI